MQLQLQASLASAATGVTVPKTQMRKFHFSQKGFDDFSASSRSMLKLAALDLTTGL